MSMLNVDSLLSVDGWNGTGLYVGGAMQMNDGWHVSRLTSQAYKWDVAHVDTLQELVDLLRSWGAVRFTGSARFVASAQDLLAYK